MSISLERIAQIAPLSGWTKSTSGFQFDDRIFSQASYGFAAPKESFGAILIPTFNHYNP